MRASVHSHHARSGRTGFSLVELMIALFLGALVVAGLVNVLIANRQAYHLQEASNFNQQNLRFVMDRISWSLRMADFWGGITPDTITLSTSAPPSIMGGGAACNNAWAFDVIHPIYGYDGNPGLGSNFPIGDCGVPPANYVAGTDVLVVRYADADAHPPSGGSALAGSNLYLLTRAGYSGVLFGAGSSGVSPPYNFPFYDGGTAEPGTYTYPYQVEVFYLQPCSVPNGAGGTLCTLTSDGGNPIPTLAHMRLTNYAGGGGRSSSLLISEPLVEGVENLQFEYGLRSSGTGQEPVQYVSADEMAAASDWSRVVSVRIGYVLRAQPRDVRLPHPFDTHGTSSNDSGFSLRLSDNCRYTISSTGAIDTSGCSSFPSSAVGTGGQAQQFVRTEMTGLVQLRNLTRVAQTQ